MLNIDSFWNIALLSIQHPGQPVPDEGADATALACGQRVQNGFVAVNSRNEPLPLAHLRGGAGPTRDRPGHHQFAGAAHAGRVLLDDQGHARALSQRLRPGLLASIDVVLGGGEQYFTPANATNEWGRRDGRNLLDEAKSRGYTPVRTRDELNNVSHLADDHRCFGLFAPDQFYFSSLQPENRRQPSLAEMTRVAISSLNHNSTAIFSSWSTISWRARRSRISASSRSTK